MCEIQVGGARTAVCIGLTRGFLSAVKAKAWEIKNARKQPFDCPICGYSGPFEDFGRPHIRWSALCHGCGALERHRLQYLVLEKILSRLETRELQMLHFAPEDFFRPYFRDQFGRYETADLMAPDVDHKVDLQRLPFGDATYDFVLASYVLAHIPDDATAIREIRRILRPGGIAVLPVPIIRRVTEEFDQPDEATHVRAPGEDYFERYKPHFARVDIYRSEQFRSAFSSSRQLRRWRHAEIARWSGRRSRISFRCALCRFGRLPDHFRPEASLETGRRRMQCLVARQAANSQSSPLCATMRVPHVRP